MIVTSSIQNGLDTGMDAIVGVGGLAVAVVLGQQLYKVIRAWRDITDRAEAREDEASGNLRETQARLAEAEAEVAALRIDLSVERTRREHVELELEREREARARLESRVDMLVAQMAELLGEQ